MKIYKIKSEILSQEVDVKIIIPSDYDSLKNSIAVYCFGLSDFELISQNFISTQEAYSIPQIIMVNCNIPNIDYGYCYGNNSDLSEDGKLFESFISAELPIKLNNFFNLSKFSIAIGHSYTANYLIYLVKHNPNLFRSVVLFAPENIETPIDFYNELDTLKQPTYFAINIGSNDLKRRIDLSFSIEKKLKKLKNKNINEKIFYIKNAGHNDIISKSILNSIEFIFKDFIDVEGGNEPAVFFKDSLNVRSIYDKSVDWNLYHYDFGLYNNAGNIDFFLQKSIDESDTSAFEYLVKEFSKTNLSANALEFIGHAFENKNDNNRALFWFIKALNKYELENNQTIFNVHISIARVYLKLKKNDDAIKTFDDIYLKKKEPWFLFVKVKTLLKYNYNNYILLLDWLNQFNMQKNKTSNSLNITQNEVDMLYLKIYTLLGDVDKIKFYTKKTL
jgi:hypothetical protein